jgi:hypothetical protein
MGVLTGKGHRSDEILDDVPSGAHRLIRVVGRAVGYALAPALDSVDPRFENEEVLGVDAGKTGLEGMEQIQLELANLDGLDFHFMTFKEKGDEGDRRR